MKRMAALLIVMLIAISGTCFTASASANKRSTKKPYYAESIKPGRYNINVTSNWALFKIEACELLVEDGKMTAEMTVNTKEYSKMYMGTYQEAERAFEHDFIIYHETSDGKYAFTVPVEALNKEIACAVYKDEKQLWYDRTLVFKTDAIPESAFIRTGIFALFQKGTTTYIVLVVVLFLLLVGVRVLLRLYMHKLRTR